jgi:putative PIN family toxin of toxin-antitoxin system
MMTRLRVVLDTNVIISSLFWTGPPFEVAMLGFRNKIALFTSWPILYEVEEKLQAKFHVPREKISFMIDILLAFMEVVIPKTEVNVIKSDREDNKILECASEIGADFVVSGDKHLLEFNEFQGAKIVSPKEFLEILKHSAL